MEKLIKQWKANKAALKSAQEALLQTEIAIYQEVKDTLPPKGTTHFGPMSIVTGYTEKWNQSEIEKVAASWPENLPCPFFTEYKVDKKIFDVVAGSVPAAAACLTLMERKPSFSVKGE